MNLVVEARDGVKFWAVLHFKQDIDKLEREELVKIMSRIREFRDRNELGPGMHRYVYQDICSIFLFILRPGDLL